MRRRLPSTSRWHAPSGARWTASASGVLGESLRRVLPQGLEDHQAGAPVGGQRAPRRRCFTTNASSVPEVRRPSRPRLPRGWPRRRTRRTDRTRSAARGSAAGSSSRSWRTTCAGGPGHHAARSRDSSTRREPGGELFDRRGTSVRAAASSIASGRPSSRVQMLCDERGGDRRHCQPPAVATAGSVEEERRRRRRFDLVDARRVRPLTGRASGVHADPDAQR